MKTIPRPLSIGCLVRWKHLDSPYLYKVVHIGREDLDAPGYKAIVKLKPVIQIGNFAMEPRFHIEMAANFIHEDGTPIHHCPRTMGR